MLIVQRGRYCEARLAAMAHWRSDLRDLQHGDIRHEIGCSVFGEAKGPVCSPLLVRDHNRDAVSSLPCIARAVELGISCMGSALPSSMRGDYGPQLISVGVR